MVSPASRLGKIPPYLFGEIARAVVIQNGNEQLREIHSDVAAESVVTL